MHWPPGHSRTGVLTHHITEPSISGRWRLETFLGQDVFPRLPCAAGGHLAGAHTPRDRSPLQLTRPVSAGGSSACWKVFPVCFSRSQISLIGLWSYLWHVSSLPFQTISLRFEEQNYRVYSAPGCPPPSPPVLPTVSRPLITQADLLWPCLCIGNRAPEQSRTPSLPQW